MRTIQTIKVPELKTPVRLNVYCESSIDFFKSRKSVKKALKKGEVHLNGKTVHGGTWLKTGDVIEILDLEETPPKPYHLELEVVFEDEDIAIVIKPAGLTVSGNQFKTLFNALPFNLQESKAKDKLSWPLPVHRLDNQTSGLVVIAKSKTARVYLGRLFEKKKIKKAYHALVMGKPYGRSGEIDSQIGGKRAITNFENIQTVPSLKNQYISLIKLFPKTGRTHQLRIHMAGIGTPILGDKLYADKTIKHKGLFLTASELKFKHPVTKKEIHVEVEIPYKFYKRLDNENRRWEKYHSTPD